MHPQCPASLRNVFSKLGGMNEIPSMIHCCILHLVGSSPNLRSGPHYVILVPGRCNMIIPVGSHEKVELYPRGHEIGYKGRRSGRSSMPFMESLRIPPSVPALASGIELAFLSWVSLV